MEIKDYSGESAYGKEVVGIAVYNDNRVPDGNPDEYREAAFYSKRTVEADGSVTVEPVTDPAIIREIEDKIALQERDNATD